MLLKKGHQVDDIKSRQTEFIVQHVFRNHVLILNYTPIIKVDVSGCEPSNNPSTYLHMYRLQNCM